MEIQIMYLVDAEENGKKIGVRQVVRAIDAKAVFGDDLPYVGQINGIYIRLPWQPEHPLEFLPRPYYWGAV